MLINGLPSIAVQQEIMLCLRHLGKVTAAMADFEALGSIR